MLAHEKEAAGRAFVRSFNTLVRLASLYRCEHQQVCRQYETAWSELQKALAGAGKLRLTAAGDNLLLDGAALKAGSSERSLAQQFNTAGMAGLSFSPGLSGDDFWRLVRTFAGSKPLVLLSDLRREFGTGAKIRPLEFDIREGEASSGPVQENGDMAIAAHLAAALIGNEPSQALGGLPDDPQKLLQLILSSAGREPAPVSPRDKGVPDAPGLGALGWEQGSPSLGEEDVARVIHWLARFGGVPNTPDFGSQGWKGPSPAHDASGPASDSEIAGIGPGAKQVFLQALGQVAEEANRGAQRPLLVALAEQLAIRYALQKYESGETPFNAVQRTLDALKKQIGDLRRTLHAREAALGHAGLPLEPAEEDFDRRFWAAIPARNKLQVLLSPDAWCIPPSNLRSFVEELRQAGDGSALLRILKNYCHLLAGDDAPCLVKVAGGVAELSDLYAAQESLLNFAIEWVGDTLARPTLPGNCRELLAKTLASLVQKAIDNHHYRSIHQLLLKPEGPQTAAFPSDQWRIQLNDRTVELVDRALVVPEPALLEVLQRIPRAAAKRIALRFAQATTTEQCDRAKLLGEKLGAPVLQCWLEALRTASDAEAIAVLGILAATDGAPFGESLAARLQRWSGCDQVQAVHSIAASGAPGRGALLMRLLPQLHPFAAPPALDEIGMAGCPEAGSRLLLQMASSQDVTPYTQLKAIEAVGRLRWQSAVPQLAEFTCARSLWKPRYSRETRIVALQSLRRIDPKLGASLASGAGISERELWMAPLAARGDGWVRHRRYARVPLGGELNASVTSATESFSLILDKMSLGGGIGTAVAGGHSPSEATLQIRAGWRALRFQALLRPQGPSKVTFEIVAIDLEDRHRLRAFLTSQATPPHRA
jgi:hypothetical protein